MGSHSLITMFKRPCVLNSTNPTRVLPSYLFNIILPSVPSSSKWPLFFSLAHHLFSHPYMLAFSTQVRGFKPSRSRRIFKGEKILSTPSFGGEAKPSVPCRRFAACKRSLNGVEVVISDKLPDNILAHSSTFLR